MQISFKPAMVTRALGGGVAIAIMVALADLFGVPVGVVPFATSIVLVIGAPESPQAQPPNLIGGHLVSATVGILVSMIGTNHILATALGLFAAMLTMMILNVFHPPAGITPVVAVLGGVHPEQMIITVVIGLVVLSLFAAAFHALPGGVGWPIENNRSSIWNRGVIRIVQVATRRGRDPRSDEADRR